jgi:hypothetical protein
VAAGTSPVAPNAGGGAAPTGSIPESQVVFDAGGHNHDGEGSAAVDHGTLTGVTANQHHNQAHALVGADHTAAGLTAGDVLTALTATTFGFAAPAGSASSHKAPFGPWTRGDINNASSGGYTSMKFATAAVQFGAELPMPFSGTVWGVGVCTENNVSGGDYSVRLSINGTTSAAIQATVTAGNDHATDTDGSGVAFAAGDRLAIYDLKSAGLGSTQSAAFLFITVD